MFCTPPPQKSSSRNVGTCSELFRVAHPIASNSFKHVVWMYLSFGMPVSDVLSTSGSVVPESPCAPSFGFSHKSQTFCIGIEKPTVVPNRKSSVVRTSVEFSFEPRGYGPRHCCPHPALLQSRYSWPLRSVCSSFSTLPPRLPATPFSLCGPDARGAAPPRSLSGLTSVAAAISVASGLLSS